MWIELDHRDLETRASRIAPSEAAAMPLPNEDSTTAGDEYKTRHDFLEVSRVTTAAMKAH